MPSDLTHVQCLWSNESFFTPDQNVQCLSPVWSKKLLHRLCGTVKICDDFSHTTNTSQTNDKTICIYCMNSSSKFPFNILFRNYKSLKNRIILPLWTEDTSVA